MKNVDIYIKLILMLLWFGILIKNTLDGMLVSSIKDILIITVISMNLVLDIYLLEKAEEKRLDI